MNPVTRINARPVRVLLADDSPFLCKLLAKYVNDAGGFHVAGTAHTGREAIAQAAQLRPDVMALDLTMPDMGGVEVIEQIMQDRPVPIVVITGASGASAVQTLKALEAGASDFVLKFDPSMPVSPEALSREIVMKLRRAARRSVPSGTAVQGGLTSVVVVGASTGGPSALRELLTPVELPFPAAIVVVQHVPAAFSGVLASDLARTTKLDVAEYKRGDRLLNGQVRVAPGGLQMILEPDGRARLETDESAEYAPSIDLTMQSAADCYGENAVGVLLTGMGTDGARGLGVIRRRGGMTLAQDPESCVVAGMPGAAIQQGVVEYVGQPADLARKIRAKLLAATGEPAHA